ncbi:MAG TPA: LysM peptidoglycan-binding domain-containing protein [Thermohalobaculum sp.]|nr:LysM peptidoglycan-binding domain-containing protein [Thermohalobaculum sp.]
MRKGLLALVVVMAVLALALLLWPREIEQGTVAPSGNASVVLPSGALADRQAEVGRDAPDRVEAPAAAEVELTPGPPDAVEAVAAPPGLSPTAPPVDAPPGEDPAAAQARSADDADAADGAERLAALTPADGETGQPTTTVAAGQAAENETTGTAKEAADEAAGEDGAPVLDLVRVAPDGQAVVAGRAEPGATVEILLDDLVIGSADAGTDGGFVAVLETGTAAEPREMRLRAPKATPTAAAAAPAPAGSAAHPGEPAADSRQDFATSAPFVILPGTDPAEAPVIVARGAEEVDVVQPGAIGAEERMALDRLTYETGGDLVAAGRGPGSRAVRTYADGRLVAEAPVGPDGDWRAVIPQGVAEDTALLRFDGIDGGGQVVSRLEAPFAYAEDGRGQEVRQREVVIERGNNLWRIAERHYGEGLRYSVIFEANAELIRNPDLIYPGQVFNVPELVEAE